jgi:hypothetical protein
LRHIVPEDSSMPDTSTTVPFSFAEPVAMRRGSVSERFVKCGKSACPCAQDPKARHGPYFSFTHAVKRRTQSRFLSSDEAAVVRRQIERGQQFRSEVDAYWKRCERVAEQELSNLEAAPQEAAKKGGSKRRSKRSSGRRPSGKSKPS